jgi:hypothetical protein
MVLSFTTGPIGAVVKDRTIFMRSKRSFDRM